jgi:hypothetical protein
MTFVPYYRLMIERDYYPGGEPYWFGKCSTCGDRITTESEDEAMDWGDNHDCDEEDGDDE